MYVPGVDYKNNELHFIIFAIYQMTPVIVCSMVAAFDMLAVFFMAFAIGLIEELSNRVEQIGEKGKTSAEQYKELIECMKIHQDIKSFVGLIQKHFSLFIMIQGFMSSLIFCSLAFIMTLVRKIERL
jgi:7tm Odorant receptor